jgi:hypothetical protein
VDVWFVVGKELGTLLQVTHWNQSCLVTTLILSTLSLSSGQLVVEFQHQSSTNTKHFITT